MTGKSFVFIVSFFAATQAHAQDIAYKPFSDGQFSPFRAPVAQNKPPAKAAKKAPRLIVVDIPLLAPRRTVSISRIKNNNVHIGTPLSPWESEVDFLSVTPEFSYSSKHTHANVYGGIAGGRDEGMLRRVRFIAVSFENSFWLFLAGVNGFNEQEKVSDMITGPQFLSDFSRKSVGGRAWLGAKVGNFSSSFLAARYGKGYIKTDGSKRYKSPTLTELESLSLYSEEFLTEMISVEGKLSHRRITGNLKMESNSYSRVFHSPDPLKYGLNDFNELKLEATAELIPFPKKDIIRVLVRGTRFYESRDSLLFRNQPPEVQVFLRIRLR